jgi:hypothetical protein
MSMNFLTHQELDHLLETIRRYLKEFQKKFVYVALINGNFHVIRNREIMGLGV